jgi:hypothetical protein
VVIGQGLGMSFAELKEKMFTLTEEERLEIQHILLHIELQNDPAHRAEMEKRMARMDAGEKYTLEDVERICRERDSQRK